MAESNSRMAEFKMKKQLFDTVGSSVICSDCQIVPRNIPIYQTNQGDVLCAECKPKSKSHGIFQNSVLEKLLMELPVSCKYQKNECLVVQDRQNISYHEEDCKYRKVLCSVVHCKENVIFDQLKDHFLNIHYVSRKLRLMM